MPRLSHDPVCPQCQARQSKVSEARESVAGSVRRRRECACGYRFTTYEQIETIPRIKALLYALGLNRDIAI